MAVPTLTPSRQSSAVVLPSTGSTADVSDGAANVSLYPFGLYADSNSAQYSQYFISGAADQVGYTYKKLGGDVLDLELTTGNVYAAYEEAVLEYSYIVNIHQTKNVLGDTFGDTTGTFDHNGQLMTGPTDVALKFPKLTFAYAKRVSERVATEANIGAILLYIQHRFQQLTMCKIIIYRILYLPLRRQIPTYLFTAW